MPEKLCLISKRGKEVNVKKSYWIYVCLFLVSISTFAARAASTKCGGVSSGCDSSTHNCSRTANVRVRCVGFGLVTTEAQEKLDYLRVVVTKPDGTQRFYTLENPPGGIADYSAAGIGRNPWVINRLRSVGALNYGDIIELTHDGYGLSSSTLAAVSSDEDKSLKQECEYTRRPYIVNFKACGRSIQACIAQNAYCINTNENGQFSPGNTLSDNMACISRNNICPPPSQCAFSKKVKIPECAKQPIRIMYLNTLDHIGYLPSGLASFADNYDENGNRVNDHGPLWHPPRNNDKGPLWHPPRSGEQGSSGSLQ